MPLAIGIDDCSLEVSGVDAVVTEEVAVGKVVEALLWVMGVIRDKEARSDHVGNAVLMIPMSDDFVLMAAIAALCGGLSEVTQLRGCPNCDVEGFLLLLL